MNDYKEYIVTVCFFTVFCFFISEILPKNRIKKYFTVCISVVFTVILIRPVYTADFKKIIDFDSLDYDGINISVKSENENIISECIEDILKEKFDIDCQSNIKCEYNGDELNIHSIEITVFGNCNEEIVKKFINENTGVTPTVTVKNNDD